MTDAVVKLSIQQESIAVVSLEDRVNKNTFSKEFITDLLNVFEKINADTALKVVVIHGYDNYFCCGGTKDELLTLAEGVGSFTDLGFYRLLLDCDIPVIAAMQGHAVGGGLAFGAYADMFVMAYECFYTTNFMKYGFTPGFGSTYIIPKLFGDSIANNMLFGAQNYQGLQLSQWGIGAQFVKKSDVVNTAIELAKNMTEMPRQSLLLLKQQLRQEDKLLLPQYISFKLPEVKTKIAELFGR